MSQNIPTLTHPQALFNQCSAKYTAFVGGFGSGKTFALVNKCLATKFQYPEVDMLFTEPTYPLMRDIAYPTFEILLDEQRIRYNLNKQDAILYIQGAGKVIFKTMQNPEKIIGFEVGDFFLDEWDTLPKDKAMEVWRRCISRARVKYPDHRWNRGHVGTTPEGYRAAYEKFVRNTTDHHAMITAPTSSNPHLPPSYVEDIRRDYPPNLVEAYLMGRFVNMLYGTVYTSFSREKNHADDLIRPSEPVKVGMDFNVGNMHAVTFVIHDGAPVAVDEITGVIDTPTMIEEIKRKYYGHHITVYPDATGRNRSSIDAYKSDVSLLRNAGFEVYVNRQNPLIRDRVLSLNTMFCNANGERSLMVNTDRCPVLTEALENQAYDDYGFPDKSQGFDHPVDAAGYFIVYEYPVYRPQAFFATARGTY